MDDFQYLNRISSDALDDDLLSRASMYEYLELIRLKAARSDTNNTEII